MERGGGEAVTLSRVTEAERHAVETLLGRRASRGATIRVPLAQVEETLRGAGIAPSLAAALEVLGGPLTDRNAEREALTASWQQLFEAHRDRVEAIGLGAWFQGLRQRGLLKRLARGDADTARELLEGALSVLERLPARGAALSTVAAEALGDAHALDRGRPVATLVRQALGIRARMGEEGESADDERTLWASAGVLVGGDITSTVLVLNLPAADNTATGIAVDAFGTVGEPTYLTLRQLLRDPPDWRCRERVVYVCENPAIVAEAAERLGISCAPLIATLGRPRAAALTLLEQLSQAGARLQYRGDLDWAGIAIANHLLARYPARPWRMDTVTLSDFQNLPGPRLKGAPVPANWDAELLPALEQRGSALEEEQMLDLLLSDLQSLE